MTDKEQNEDKTTITESLSTSEARPKSETRNFLIAQHKTSQPSTPRNKIQLLLEAIFMSRGGDRIP